MRHSLALTSLLCALALPAAQATAAPAFDSCESPRATVQTWIDNLQESTWRPDVSIHCFDFSGGPQTTADRQAIARELLSVLDGQGKFVVYSRIPAEADYTDPTSGLSQYTLFPSIPQVIVEKQGSAWVIPASTLRATPALYRSTYRIPLERLAHSLPAPLTQPALGLPTWTWITLVIALLLSLIGGRVTEWVVGPLARRLLGRTLGAWDKAFERRLLRRVNWLSVAIFSGLLVPNIGLPVRLNQVLLVAIKLLASVASVLIATGVVDLCFNAWKRRAEGTATKMDDQLIPLLRRATKTLVGVIGGLFVLQNLDVDVASLLAGLGLGGLAFALAAKDTLANLFGSLTIFADRPFQIGDVIEIGGVTGTVEEVGFRSTRIRTFQDSLVTVPNSDFASAKVDNLGWRRFRRWRSTIGLTYDSSPEQIQAFVEGVRATILASPVTRKDAFEVHFNAFGPSSLDVFVSIDFEVAGWTDELKGRHNLLLEWMRLARDLKLDFAFPTQTLHVETLAAARTNSAAPTPQDRSALQEVVTSYGPQGGRAVPVTAELTGGFWPEPADEEPA